MESQGRTMLGEIRFGIVDDHPVFRAGVIHTLAQAGLTCVGEAASPEEAVRIAGEQAPDIILLDIDRAGHSLSAVRTIAGSCPGMRLLLLAEAPDQQQVMVALQAGASGYAPKSIGGPELIESMRSVRRGDTYVYPALLAGAAINPAPVHRPDVPLTKLHLREEQILRHLVNGLSNKEIARELNLSDKTVKHYLTSLMQKLKVHNRVEAALIAAKYSSTPASTAIRSADGNRLPWA